MLTKYCLIFSFEEDLSTTDVLQWLKRLDKKFIRVNCGSDKIAVHKVVIENGYYDISIQINDELLKLEQISTIWYRRGSILRSFNLDFADQAIQKQFYFDYLQNESKDLAIHLLKTFGKTKQLNSIFNAKLNKLDVLDLAQDLDISIPATLVTSSKAELEMFYLKHNHLITKSISDALNYNFEGTNYIKTFTESINYNFISTLPDVFFPSLFQEQIDKKFEVRAFYLDGDFYSMAIFSQADAKTQVDFRNYNRNRPNRNVPFLIPTFIKERLVKLFDKLNINSGSVDLAVDKNDEYKFFEINPVGQFGMVSYPCNYNLERKIAEFL